MLFYIANRMASCSAHQLRLHEPWQNISFLNLALQEAVQTHLPGEADRVFADVVVQGAKARPCQPVSALEGLILHYKVRPTIVVH